MFLLGELEHGLYPKPSGIHPSIAEQCGLGEDMQERIAADITQHIHHDAVPVPDVESPFTSQNMEDTFNQALDGALQSGVIPSGFSLLPGEWAGAAYPASERIKVARKDVDIPLPFEVWYPRAVRWAQGLTILELVQEHSS